MSLLLHWVSTACVRVCTVTALIVKPEEYNALCPYYRKRMETTQTVSMSGNLIVSSPCACAKGEVIVCPSVCYYKTARSGDWSIYWP